MLKKLAVTSLFGFASISAMQIEETQFRSLTNEDGDIDLNQVMADPDVQAISDSDKFKDMAQSLISGEPIDFTELLSDPSVQNLANKLENGEFGDVNKLMQAFGAADLLSAGLDQNSHFQGLPTINKQAADAISKYLDDESRKLPNDDIVEDF